MYITGINDVRPPHGVWPGVWSGVWPGAYFEDQGESIPLHQRAVVYYQLLQQEAVSTKTYFFSHFSLFQLLTCNVYSFIKIYCSSWIIRFKSSLSNAANRLTDNQFSPNKPLMYHSRYHRMKCPTPLPGLQPHIFLFVIWKWLEGLRGGGGYCTYHGLMNSSSSWNTTRLSVDKHVPPNENCICEDRSQFSQKSMHMNTIMWSSMDWEEQHHNCSY